VVEAPAEASTDSEGEALPSASRLAASVGERDPPAPKPPSTPWSGVAEPSAWPMPAGRSADAPIQAPVATTRIAAAVATRARRPASGEPVRASMLRDGGIGARPVSTSAS
jgi:hypothetical protein